MEEGRATRLGPRTLLLFAFLDRTLLWAWPRCDGLGMHCLTGCFSAPRRGASLRLSPPTSSLARRRWRGDTLLTGDFDSIHLSLLTSGRRTGVGAHNWTKSLLLCASRRHHRAWPGGGGGGEQCWIFDLFLQLLPLDSNPAQRRWMRGTILAWSFLSCGSRCQIQEWPGGVRGGKHCWMWTLLLCASCLLPLTSGLAHATPLSVQTAEWHVYKKLTSGLTHAPRYLRR